MRFRLLGDVEVRTDAGWRCVGATKWRTLLALLLLDAGRPVPPELLVEEIWADRPPDSARKLVQLYVHRLRRLTGDPDGAVLRTAASGYLVAVGPGELDATRFEELVAAGRDALGTDPVRAADRLAAALALWRGPACAGVPRTPRVRLAVDRLDRARLEAVESWTDARLALGDAGPALPRLRELAAAHPVREELHVRLLRALLACGHRSEAIEAYRRLRRALDRELGVAPGAAIDALAGELTALPAGRGRAEPGPAHGRGMRAARTRRVPDAVPAQLPPPAVPFVGRRQDVTAVRHALSTARRAGRVGVCLLSGMGGCGKSALAVRVGHALRGHFPHGTLYLDLRGSGGEPGPVPPAEALGTLLRSLGVARPPASVAEASAAYRSMLAERRVLVVLDDAVSAAQVRPLLPGGAGCAALVTSRRTLPTLDAARPYEVGPLPVADAVRLLDALTDGVYGVEERATIPAATMERLAELCDGVPLALRIVAARLRGTDPAALAARLSNERRRLDELQIDDLAVRSAFEAGYRSLAGSGDATDRAAARVWRLLADSGLREHSGAVHGVVLAADAAVTERLLAGHLVEARGGGRYRMHDLAPCTRRNAPRPTSPRRSGRRRCTGSSPGTPTPRTARPAPSARSRPSRPDPRSTRSRCSPRPARRARGWTRSVATRAS